MKHLSCYGSYDADNKQCIRCNDMDCIHITNVKMEKEKITQEDFKKACRLLEKSAEEIENIYGKYTELSNEIRDFLVLMNAIH